MIFILFIVLAGRTERSPTDNMKINGLKNTGSLMTELYNKIFITHC